MHRVGVVKPHLLFIQEAWPDHSTPEITLDGYFVAGRLDRQHGRKAGYGGIMLLSRNDVQDVVHACDSETVENQWFTLISDCGPILLGNWYRAQDAGEPSITTSLRNELAQLIDSHSGVFMFGDFNIHHKKWLRFSSGNTRGGELLHQICNDFDLHQCVREPTRPTSGYVLDLVLTHGDNKCMVNVVPPIADHNVIQCRVNISSTLSPPQRRLVWRYKTANWDGLKKALREARWSFVDDMGLDEAVQMFKKTLLTVSELHIKREYVIHRSCSHPWVIPRGRQAIVDKQ